MKSVSWIHWSISERVTYFYQQVTVKVTLCTFLCPVSFSENLHGIIMSVWSCVFIEYITKSNNVRSREDFICQPCQERGIPINGTSFTFHMCYTHWIIKPPALSHFHFILYELFASPYLVTMTHTITHSSIISPHLCPVIVDSLVIVLSTHTLVSGGKFLPSFPVSGLIESAAE